MKIRIGISVALAVFVAVACSWQHAFAAQDAGNAKIEGVWRAHDSSGPLSVVLNVSNESGSLSGAILFYLIRKEPGQPATASPGIPEPLIDPKFDGVTLTFAVSHRRAHPPRTLSDPPARFRLSITGPDTGKLVNELEPDAGPEIVRDSY